jgi:hypothetical protein
MLLFSELVGLGLEQHARFFSELVGSGLEILATSLKRIVNEFSNSNFWLEPFYA